MAEQRIVRNKSIRNVDDERLIVDLGRLHDMLHTAAGLQAHDGPRRGLIDNGRKGHLIHAELLRRGLAASSCQFCNPLLLLKGNYCEKTRVG
jgi:hypothetical protein